MATVTFQVEDEIYHGLMTYIGKENLAEYITDCMKFYVENKRCSTVQEMDEIVENIHQRKREIFPKIQRN